MHDCRAYTILLLLSISILWRHKKAQHIGTRTELYNYLSYRSVLTHRHKKKRKRGRMRKRRKRRRRKRRRRRRKPHTVLKVCIFSIWLTKALAESTNFRFSIKVQKLTVTNRLTVDIKLFIHINIHIHRCPSCTGLHVGLCTEYPQSADGLELSYDIDYRNIHIDIIFDK